MCVCVRFVKNTKNREARNILIKYETFGKNVSKTQTEQNSNNLNEVLIDIENRSF